MTNYVKTIYNLNMTNQEVLELIDVNPVLQQQIIDSIPNNLDETSKALFLYTKLCSVLDYDDLFWASEQQGPAQERHADPEFIKYVTSQNPYVVCYDFNIICAKLMEKIGAKVEFRHGQDNIKYGSGHTDLYLVITQNNNLPSELQIGDSIRLLGYSDMNNIKVDGNVSPALQKRENEKPKDYRSRTKQFENLVLAITKEVLKQDDLEKKRQAEKIYNKENVEQLVQEYTKFSTQNNMKLEEIEKFNLLFEQFGKIDLRELPALLYAKQMFSNITQDLEDKDKYRFTVIKEKQGPESYTLAAIMSSKGENSNYYLKIDPPHDLKEISHEQLQNDFLTGNLDYMNAYFSPKVIIPDIQSPFLDEKIQQMFPMEEVNAWMNDGFDIENDMRFHNSYGVEYAKYIKFRRGQQIKLNNQSTQTRREYYNLEQSNNKTQQKTNTQESEYEKVY